MNDREFLAAIGAAAAGGNAASEVLRLTIERFRADSGTVHLLESDGILHLEAASQGIPQAVLEAVRKVPVGRGMAGLAVERRQPVTSCNIQTDASGDVRPGARATGLAGAIVVPMFHGAEAVGALGIGNRAERTFTEQEIDLLMKAGRLLAERTRLRTAADG